MRKIGNSNKALGIGYAVYMLTLLVLAFLYKYEVLSWNPTAYRTILWLFIIGVIALLLWQTNRYTLKEEMKRMGCVPLNPALLKECGFEMETDKDGTKIYGLNKGSEVVAVLVELREGSFWTIVLGKETNIENTFQLGALLTILGLPEAEARLRKAAIGRYESEQ